MYKKVNNYKILNLLKKKKITLKDLKKCYTNDDNDLLMLIN